MPIQQPEKLDIDGRFSAALELEMQGGRSLEQHVTVIVQTLLSHCGSRSLIEYPWSIRNLSSTSFGIREERTDIS